MEEILSKSLLEISSLLKERKITSVELTKLCLDNIEKNKRARRDRRNRLHRRHK